MMAYSKGPRSEQVTRLLKRRGVFVGTRRICDSVKDAATAVMVSVASFNMTP